MTAQATNLGILNRLPREVRDIIWGSVCSPRGDQSNPHVKNSLASLETCRQIYKELSAKVYDNETLTIRVFPKYRIDSWLCFENSRGAKWHVKDLEDARARQFANLPHKRLKGVTISIEATQRLPEREDLGQIICLFFKMRDVAKILLEAHKGGLHALGLELLDSATAKWYERGAPKVTLLVIRDVPTYVPEWDFSAVWLPLYTYGSLRGLMDVGQIPHEIRDFLEEVDGQERDEEPMSEEMARERSDVLYAHLDVALDGEAGETAEMLRLHRFSTWYPRGPDHGSDYLRELERMWKYPAWQGGWNENDSIAIERRYFKVHALNPLITERQRETPPFSHFLKDCKLAVTLSGGWDRDEWFRCYPTGIKPWKFNDEGWRTLRYKEEGHIYRKESDAFALRFGGQASRFLSDRFGDE